MYYHKKRVSRAALEADEAISNAYIIDNLMALDTEKSGFDTDSPS